MSRSIADRVMDFGEQHPRLFAVAMIAFVLGGAWLGYWLDGVYHELRWGH